MEELGVIIAAVSHPNVEADLRQVPCKFVHPDLCDPGQPCCVQLIEFKLN